MIHVYTRDRSYVFSVGKHLPCPKLVKLFQCDPNPQAVTEYAAGLASTYQVINELLAAPKGHVRHRIPIYRPSGRYASAEVDHFVDVYTDFDYEVFTDFHVEHMFAEPKGGEPVYEICITQAQVEKLCTDAALMHYLYSPNNYSGFLVVDPYKKTPKNAQALLAQLWASENYG